MQIIEYILYTNGYMGGRLWDNLTQPVPTHSVHMGSEQGMFAQVDNGVRLRPFDKDI